MKSFKTVSIILGLTVTALVYFSVTKNNTADNMVEDAVGTSVAAPKADIPL
jgi:hypothetical protein